jgi:hypothetical protein
MSSAETAELFAEPLFEEPMEAAAAAKSDTEGTGGTSSNTSRNIT